MEMVVSERGRGELEPELPIGWHRVTSSANFEGERMDWHDDFCSMECVKKWAKARLKDPHV